LDWEDKSRFLEFIIENEVVGFFNEPIKLKSGRLSSWYVNWRTIAQDAFLIDQLTDFILSFVKFLNLTPDCFYGVPEGATKLGIITQLKWAKEQSNYSKGTYLLPMGRGKLKEHGDPKDRFFLGEPKGKVIILEDTTTTAGSLITAIKSLEKLDLDIIASIVMTERNEIRDDGKNVKEILLEENVKFFAMSDALEIIPLLKPNKLQSNEIMDYFKKYGTRQIDL
jgi:orotate phosphoribosyltransferase